MKSDTKLQENRNENGSALIELVCALPVLVLLFAGTLEMARLICFKYLLQLAAWDIGVFLASQEIALEEQGLISEIGPWLNDSAPRLTEELKREIVDFLGSSPGSQYSFTNRSPVVFSRLDIRLYAQRATQGGRHGFKTTVVACLPHFSSMLWNGEDGNQERKNCMNQYVSPSRDSNLVFGLKFSRIRATAFVPRHASYPIFHLGLATPSSFVGLDNPDPNRLFGPSTSHQLKPGTMKWFKENRSTVVAAGKKWIERGSIFPSVKQGEAR